MVSPMPPLSGGRSDPLRGRNAGADCPQTPGVRPRGGRVPPSLRPSLPLSHYLQSGCRPDYRSCNSARQSRFSCLDLKGALISARELVPARQLAAVLFDICRKKRYQSIMTLTVSLPPQLESFIHRTVSSGRYMSASDVVSAALRLLEE